jgi:SAM-dependent methyltransferase
LSFVPSRGDLYDWEQAHVLGRSDQDLPFYLEQALATGGPVLELGCGTGRITGGLTGAGFEVVGLDVDAQMMDVARRRQLGAQLVEADMRRFALHRRFPLVIVPYNGLQLLLSHDDRVRCLRAIEGHLAEGGRVAFEVHDFLTGVQTTEIAPEPLATAPLGDSTVTLHAGLRHDLERRVSTYTRRFEVTDAGGATQNVDHDIALYSYVEGELAALLQGAGLTGTSARTGTVERWVATRIAERSGQGG